ncbi:MAG: hypothetical protein JSR56_01675 [Proteobacteria bacterium]|nr:hypothetical protein [Pseudomonadota bacterium]
MNTRKSVAIVAAMLITAAGMSGIANYSNAAADSARNPGRASAQVITTLPTIQVSPSAEQLRQLRNEGNKDGSAAATATNNAKMPYYSFAADDASA